ncbi:Succinyl-CoA ligase [ADP-forming] subunit beta [compost metagenome]
MGSVATIANGAGLAMATVDAVSNHSLVPANFLDIGGGASTASVLAAFERILLYPNINAIVINIFAGITRCDEIANAIIAAKKEIPRLPPLYIRLAGTNYEAATELLRQENIPLFSSLEESLSAVTKERAS